MEEKETKKKKESKFWRFIITLVWLALSVGVDFYAVMEKSFVLGIAAELVFFVITFCVPYLRKKGTYTRWFGWLALLQAAWLAFLMFSAGN